MKIAIPLHEGRLAGHFGHCGEFALVDADPSAGSVGAVKTLQAPAHAPGVLPSWLRAHGVDVVIAGGMGRRAQALFAEAGIQVVVGAEGGEPVSLAASYLGGTLTTGENLCDH